MGQELSNAGKWKAEGEKYGTPERINTTGAFVKPKLVDGKWCWVVVEFESDSFYDGDYIGLETEGETWQELVRDDDEDEAEATQQLNEKQLAHVMAVAGYEYKPFIANGLTLHGWHTDGYPVLVFPFLEGAVITRAYLSELFRLLADNEEVGGRLYIVAPTSAIPFIGDYLDIEHFRFVFASVADEMVLAVSRLAR